MANETKKTEVPVKAQVKKPEEVKVVKKTADKPKKPVAKAKKSEKKVEKKVISEVSAKARFIRIAPRKVRLVIDQLRGMDTEVALVKLQFMTKGSVAPITKLLNSAIANAENNFSLDRKDLFIKTFTADDGPILKRFTPRAHGRSTSIRKRTSHINLILGIKSGSKTVVKKDAAKGDIKVISPDEIKKESGPKTPGATSQGQGGDSKGFLKGMFQRKTG
jgi:large subunit ribosomal protein L22